MTKEQLQVARTILSQLGENHFISCVGAKNICYLESGLKLDFMRNLSKANQLVVKYDAGTDTYIMQFWKKATKFDTYKLMGRVEKYICKKYNIPKGARIPDTYADEYNARYEKLEVKALAKAEPILLHEYVNCYCDDLRRLFENVTKLRTSLKHIYGDNI